MNERDNPSDDLLALLASAADGSLTPEEAERLSAQLRESETVRELYADFMMLQVQLELEHLPIGQEASTLARSASEESTHHAPRDVCQAGSQPTSSTPQLSSAHALQQPTAMDTHTHHAERDGYYDAPRDAQSPLRGSFVRTLAHSAREMVWHPMAAVLLVGLIATAIIVYQFSTAPTQPPVAIKPPIALPAEPAATLTGATDAHWLGKFPTQGDAIAPGQRLVLQRGSAMVAFSSQARVVFDAPVEFEIVDKGACRLVSGKLTAHVPDPAKGFQVQTPSGTVTDLGTEFGVYVRNEAAGVRLEEVGEEEQQPGGGPQQDGTQPPTTEVHVFRGQVELAQAPTDPKSQIPNRGTRDSGSSQIISAGQAATITDNKVQPLPAADPFKFALEKLNGKPRQVLLSEDFETYELGKADKAIGPWIVQGGTFRKGQGVDVIDPAATIAQLLAERDISIPHASPSPANGQRVARCVSSMDFPKDTYPLLAREIDCREFAHRCQVLVEFDLFAQGDWTEPSLAFAAEVSQAPGIALWQNSDAAAPKIEWQPNRWYRVRVLLDVTDGAVRSMRAERSLWAGAEGWVRDTAFTPPIPQVDWKSPPRYVIFGFPVPPTGKSGGHYWLDNIRVEAIGETTKSLGAGTEKTFDNP